MLSDFDRSVAEQIRAADPPFYALIAAAVMKADSSNLRTLSRGYPDIVRAVIGDEWYRVVWDVLTPIIVGCACAPDQGLMCLHHWEIAEESAASIQTLSAEELLEKLARSSAYGKEAEAEPES